ncbi:DUF397 domain-containing protein [Amycolatopsis sp. NPDC059021]|uniref:DUF397 domain-containing protein n=1 Tax=Amycolatopsis sp. NPDC059021 TaxID=3346704 RepID=UPI00366D7279
MTEEPTWRKSSYSGGTGNNECIELQTGGGGERVKIRDSKAPRAGHLTITADAHRALLKAIRSDEQGA